MRMYMLHLDLEWVRKDVDEIRIISTGEVLVDFRSGSWPRASQQEKRDTWEYYVKQREAVTPNPWD